MKHKNLIFFLITVLLFFALLLGIAGGVAGYFIGQEIDNNDNEETNYSSANNETTNVEQVKVVDEESAITEVAANSMESVVSIVITADVPTFENYYFNPYQNDYYYNDYLDQLGVTEENSTGTEKQEIGAGSGFIISSDGLIITNRHVVEDENASYTVILNDGTKKEATVLAKDTILDIAFIKIEGNDYPALKLGESDNLKVGQTAIVIGNALGEFSNTVSVGIISGLGREIIASDSFGSMSETISDVIQTDASINFGNSGGPLLDLSGKVIGVNVAIASDGENIGFAIPIDVVKDLQSRLNEKGEIERPVLGVRYLLVDESIKKELDLSVDYGAYITSEDSTEIAVVKDSPAAKVNLKEGDIILEVDGTKVDSTNTLQSLIQDKYIGDKVTLKILDSEGKEKEVEVELFKF